MVMHEGKQMIMCEELNTPMTNELRTILRDSKSIKGPTTRYILNTKKIIESELLKKERIGEKDDKTHSKVILLVGETGTGKTTLINAIFNYIMGVRWEHRMWLEISECLDEKSQTKAVTVYEVFARDSPFALTIIDTPGFGNTQGREKDKHIAETLQQLFTSEDGIHEIDAVCLVLKATESRLHERQRYIQNAILSLFGKNLEDNIIMLLTNSHENVPKKLLNFIKASQIPCAKGTDGQPVYFKFDNCQSECNDEEDRESYKSSWDHGIENFKQFFDYLNVIDPRDLNMTADLLSARKQLDENVKNLENKPIALEKRRKKIEEVKRNLGELEAYRIIMHNFEYEVEEFYEEKVHVESLGWSLATCCNVCKENCHYPGCWWFTHLSWCSVMLKGNCTVCTGKCHYSEHVKDDKIYVIVSRKVKKTEKNMEEKWEKDVKKEQGLITELQTELTKIKEEMNDLSEKCNQCLEKLKETALKSTSLGRIF